MLYIIACDERRYRLCYQCSWKYMNGWRPGLVNKWNYLDISLDKQPIGRDTQLAAFLWWPIPYHLGQGDLLFGLWSQFVSRLIHRLTGLQVSPRPTQPSIPPWSVNEYQLRLRGVFTTGRAAIQIHVYLTLPLPTYAGYDLCPTMVNTQTHRLLFTGYTISSASRAKNEQIAMENN